MPSRSSRPTAAITSRQWDSSNWVGERRRVGKGSRRSRCTTASSSSTASAGNVTSQSLGDSVSPTQARRSMSALHEHRLDVVDHEVGDEEAGAVDVADVAVGIHQEDLEHVTVPTREAAALIVDRRAVLTVALQHAVEDMLRGSRGKSPQAPIGAVHPRVLGKGGRGVAANIEADGEEGDSACQPLLPHPRLEALQGEARQRTAEALGTRGVDEAHHRDLARAESLRADTVPRVVAQHEARHAVEGGKLVGAGGGRCEARREHALDELLLEAQRLVAARGAGSKRQDKEEPDDDLSATPHSRSPAGWPHAARAGPYSCCRSS